MPILALSLGPRHIYLKSNDYSTWFNLLHSYVVDHFQTHKVKGKVSPAPSGTVACLFLESRNVAGCVGTENVGLTVCRCQKKVYFLHTNEPKILEPITMTDENDAYQKVLEELSQVKVHLKSQDEKIVRLETLVASLLRLKVTAVAETETETETSTTTTMVELSFPPRQRKPSGGLSSRPSVDYIFQNRLTSLTPPRTSLLFAAYAHQDEPSSPNEQEESSSARDQENDNPPFLREGSPKMIRKSVMLVTSDAFEQNTTTYNIPVRKPPFSKPFIGKFVTEMPSTSTLSSTPKLPTPANPPTQLPNGTAVHLEQYGSRPSFVHMSSDSIAEDSEIAIMLKQTERTIVCDSVNRGPSLALKNLENDYEGIENLNAKLLSIGIIPTLPREIGFDIADDSSKSPLESTTKEKAMAFLYQHVQSKAIKDAFDLWGRYTGSVNRVTKLPHGRGKMMYTDGDGRMYDGDWIRGHWQGDGTIRNAMGDVYVGSIVQDLKDGQGTMSYADGRTFMGIFKDDHPVKGTIAFPDGSKYTGQMMNGLRKGQGAYFFADGSFYEGEFDHNQLHGEGMMTWPDGGWYYGNWVNGVMHGQGMEVLAGGSLRHEGQWNAGMPVRT
jgi:hypothetical protein